MRNQLPADWDEERVRRDLTDFEDRFESAILTKSLKEDCFLALDEVAKRLGL